MSVSFTGNSILSRQKTLREQGLLFIKVLRGLTPKRRGLTPNGLFLVDESFNIQYNVIGWGVCAH